MAILPSEVLSGGGVGGGVGGGGDSMPSKTPINHLEAPAFK